jgi:WhiB family redox-sensing transcriptional regulator
MAQFFSAAGESRVATRLRVARAKSLCAQCPVRPECAAQALTTREEHGVWGGFTSLERKRLLALGWTDLVDQRHARADVAGLERRLADGPTESASVEGIRAPTAWTAHRRKGRAVHAAEIDASG